MNHKILYASVAGLLASPGSIYAEDYRVGVSIENLAPMNGTFQTPFWVGFHNGVEFDTYDSNTPASSLPLEGSVAMERLCEDGDTGPISADFAQLSGGVDATLASSDGPLAPGAVAYDDFLLDSANPDHRYFSYASMIIPSNDFCLSNGNPQAHAIFDEAGVVVASSFFISGDQALDAGTELNDEVPENTAFFGQMAADTGADENGNIGTLSGDISGFLPKGGGGILDDGRFSMADFSQPGYPFAKVRFEVVPAITEELNFLAELSPVALGDNDAASVSDNDNDTALEGRASFGLTEDGTRLDYSVNFKGLRKVTAAHLQLSPAGDNGQVVAELLPGPHDIDPMMHKAQQRFAGDLVQWRRLTGELKGGQLEGPMTGQPLDALVAEIQAGHVYLNIRSARFPEGELSGVITSGVSSGE